MGPYTSVFAASPVSRPRELARYKPTFVNGVRLHATHRLYTFRGLVFCNTCGFVAGHKVRKLKDPCGHDLPVMPSPKGADNLDRLWKGLLPRSTPAWPADASSGKSFISLGTIASG